MKEEKKQAKKVNKKKKDEEQDKENTKEAEELSLDFLDQDNLQNIVDNVKYCLERSAKLVVLQLSYDTPCSPNNTMASVKFFFDYIKTVIFLILFNVRNWNKIACF